MYRWSLLYNYCMVPRISGLWARVIKVKLLSLRVEAASQTVRGGLKNRCRRRNG